jgi:hypothetical protein
MGIEHGIFQTRAETLKRFRAGASGAAIVARYMFSLTIPWCNNSLFCKGALS